MPEKIIIWVYMISAACWMFIAGGWLERGEIMASIGSVFVAAIHWGVIFACQQTGILPIQQPSAEGDL